jgi:sensor domain CHASE-containing protein
MNDRLYYSREAEVQAQRQQLILVLIVAGFSLLIGTIVTLFLTPVSGSDIRRSVGEKFEEVRRDVEARVQNARD